MKRWAVLSLVGALVLGVAPNGISTAATGTIVDEGWYPKLGQTTVGLQSVTLMDQADSRETTSVLRGIPERATGRWKSCATVDDANCKGVEIIEFGAILQQCATPTAINCLAEFGLVRSDGTKVPATFERNFPSEALNKYPADSATGLPVGGPGALWTFPATEALTHRTHYVRATVLGSAKPGEKFEYNGFAASVHAVSMTTKNCSKTFSWNSQTNPCTSGDYSGGSNAPGYSSFIDNLGSDAGLDCIMTGNPDRTTDKAECALRKNLPLDVSYYLTVRLAQSPQGWLHGRLTDADVAITSIADTAGAVTLSMRGKPVRVPVVHKEVNFADLPATLKTKYAAKGSWPSSTGGTGYSKNYGLPDVDSADGTKRNRNSNPPSYGPDGIEELEAWLSTINDTSTADRSTWSVRTLSTWEKQNANACFTDKTRVTGLVLTNATQYAAGAPTYNKETKSLDYKVSAPHYMSSGEEFKGSYQLLVRADVAKCVYGFTSPGVKATMSVVESTSGVTSSAVTNVAFRDGWFSLSATGYTHSTPTVRTVFVESSTPNVNDPLPTPSTSTTSSSVPASGAPTPTSDATATTGALSVKVTRSISRTALLKAAKLSTTKSSKVTLKIAARSAQVCRVVGTTVRGLKKGSCSVTVTVVTGKKRSVKTISIKVI